MDELKAAGIEPFATLYHWDLPQALQDKYGGWQPSEISKAFGEYSGLMAKTLSDRVTHYDYDRVMYLRNGMMWQQHATAEGVPLKGNFYWSTMDNFEWINGYGDRFGLVHVDYKTQKRTPKLSASWYREAARRNTVV